MNIPFRHPLATHAAGTILGKRRNGSPIYAIAGGNGEGEGASGSDGGADAGQGAVTGGADGQQTAATGTQQAAAQAGAAKDDGADHAATVARLEKDLAEVRNEAAKARIAKNTAAEQATTELAQKVAKALGLVPEDAPPDPAKLAEQITTQTSRIGELESALKAKDVELAVRAAAEKHQAKPGSLLDSRSFLKTIGDLDPADKGFASQLDAAIKQAVADNPSYRTAPQAGRSGADITGGPGETGKAARPTSLGAAIGSHYGK